MKKILLMSALSIAAFGTMNAQNAATTTTQTTGSKTQLPQVRAKAMVAKINTACGLQGEQVGKVNNLYIEYFTKLDALGTTPEAAKVKELNTATDASLKGILSPSQLKFWQEASSSAK